MPARDTVIALEKGHYRLAEQIGASVYGVLWRATGPGAGSDVALKLVNREQMARAQPGQRERWIASAATEIAFLQALAPWDGRHIVRLLDSGWCDGLPVLALELLQSDLARHLAHRRAAGASPGLAQVLDWLGQLNQALAKVHGHGWRYLDLKPANILVTRDGGVKLADFGTNRPLADAAAHSYAGTANWQAPEQFVPAPGGGYATGRQTDYFALGALFHYLVTGGTPLRWNAACAQAYRTHPADCGRHLLDAHGGSLPPPLAPDEEARFAALLPRAARDPALALLRALLAADPVKRPRDAVQISRMLQAVRAAAGCAPLRAVRPALVEACA